MPYIINRQTELNKRVMKFVPPGGMKIVHKDLFHMEGVYFYLHEWFVENGYAPASEPDWPEILYVQREGAAGIELWIKWRFTKDGKDKLFKWDIDMDWHILGMKDAEATVKGRKMKLNTAECEIQFYPRVMENPDFSKEPIYLKMKDFLLQRFLKKKVDKEEDDLYEEAIKLQEAIKGYFRIDTYLSEPAFERFYQTRTGEEHRGPV